MEYKVVRSRRKTVAIEVNAFQVIVRAPFWVSSAKIKAFVEQNSEWIEKKKDKFETAMPLSVEKLTNEEITELTNKAREIIPPIVAYYADIIGVSYGKITIRHQKTKWGSCSSSGNLNFNCLLMLAPENVLRSVIVHELCHRKEMSHSKNFYNEIYCVFPEYKECRDWLKKNGNALLYRIK